MKNFFIATFLVLSVILFASCLDSEEKIVLNTDHSGTYTMSLNMGRMLEMAASMGAVSKDTAKQKEKKDTTVYLKDLMDNAANLSTEEKEMYRDGKLMIKMDEEKNEMKIVVSCSFKDATGLKAIKQNFFEIIKKVKAFENATGEKEKVENEADVSMGVKSANPIADQFTFSAAPGKISNSIVNVSAYKDKIASDSTLTMMSQMTAMMGEFKYRTILVLPNAVKKFEGPSSTVSADKKTVTFETTLTEMMEHPEKVSYLIEY